MIRGHAGHAYAYSIRNSLLCLALAVGLRPVYIPAALARRMAAAPASFTDSRLFQLVQSLHSSFETFKMAGEEWNGKLGGSSVTQFSRRTDHPAIFMKFPDADQDVTKGG